jgi:hypothetical protein
MVAYALDLEREDLKDFAGLKLRKRLAYAEPDMDYSQRENAVRNLDATIEKVRERGLPVERGALERFESERIPMRYPELNTSFLEMSNKVEVENGEIRVPRFGVFPYNGSDFGVGFEIRVSEDGNHTIYSAIYFSEDSDNKDIVPEVFRNDIRDSFRLGEGTEYNTKERFKSIWLKHENVNPKRAINYILPEKKAFQFTVGFNSHLPDETYNHVCAAAKLFERENVYFIAEVKPEEWGHHIVPDPLVVGVHNDKAYLIDKFDPTPLEELISQEFVGKR